MYRPLLTCLGLFLFLTVRISAQAPDSAAPVRFTVVRDHALHDSVRLSGTVEATRTSVVASEVAGVVEEFLAREGDEMKRGQPPIRLRREPVELRLRAAQGQLAEAEAGLGSAELRLGRVRELSG